MALAMAGAVEREHMGHPDFRAPGPGGRIFATIHHSHETGGLMLTPEQQQGFLRDAPDAFFPAAGAWGRAGATMVRFAAADEETVGEAMTLAWQNAMAKAKQRKSPAKSKAPVRKTKSKGRT
jgi:hypothetical protein